MTRKGSCATAHNRISLIKKIDLSRIWKVVDRMWKEEGRKIKELLEQYEDREIRNSEMQAERKENQFEPSKEFKEAMGQMFEHVPKRIKTLRYQKLQSYAAFACAMLARAAILAVLLVVFTSDLLGNGLLTASVNQIVLNTDTEDAEWLTFSVNPLKDPDELKQVSELAFEFPYLPAGYEFKSDELLPRPLTRVFRYAKGAEHEISIVVSKLGKNGHILIVGTKEYSVFQADTIEVTETRLKNGDIFYTWVRSDYLFILRATEDLQEEIGQLIASINIS